jgi:putative redox protein
MRIELERIDDALNFKATDENGHSVNMDAGEDNGGKGNGIRPMQMLIMGLGGCSVIDLVLILKKQRQDVKDVKISIDCEREKDKEVTLWENIVMHFKIYGDVDMKKAERAVNLSVEKYCSVAKTLEAAGATITYKVSVIKD